MYRIYHSFLKVRDYFKHQLFSEGLGNLSVVLTFDDEVDESSIRIPRFLSEGGVKVTFFVPPAKMKDKFIREIVSLGHEIGGHGYSHTEEEAEENYRNAAPKCYKHLEEFYPSPTSWRFPGLRTSKKAFKNVKEAGFEIDSTRGTYYPFQSTSKYQKILECPFLRIPPSGQMDIDVKDYATIFDFVKNKVLHWKGVAVLPFHTEYQNNHFSEFKGLIQLLKREEVKFEKLKDVPEEV